MIIGENFVFIHNPHTGGAFIRSAFREALPSAFSMKLEDWHKPIDSLQIKYRDKIKFGMVRNPWAWYVSFYLHQQPNGQFLRLFLDGKSNEFSRFLSNMLSTNFIKKRIDSKFHPVGNPYLPVGVPKFKYMHSLDVGFFSYRYIYMFCFNYKEIFNEENKTNIIRNHDKWLSLDVVGKTENLVADLSNFCIKYKLPVNKKHMSKWHKRPKENSYTKKPYTKYYNSDLIRLVEQKDRMIIKKYGYKYGS